MPAGLGFVFLLSFEVSGSQADGLRLCTTLSVGLGLRAAGADEEVANTRGRVPKLLDAADVDAACALL